MGANCAERTGYEYQNRWQEYRRLKTTLLILIFGWVPFGLIIGYVLPKLSGSYNATYIAAAMFGFVKILSRVEFSYDANANLVQETKTDIATTLPREMLAAMEPAQLQAVHAMFGTVGEPVCRMHRYDESGRRVETRSQIGLLGEDIEVMVYNEHGDQISKVSQHETREYEIDDKGQLTDAPIKESTSRSEVRFRYDYDAKGTWTRKTVETRAEDDQQFTECNIERRTIEYFGSR